MFGRIGGLVGSNLIGIFLEDSCSSIFYVFSALTLSELTSQDLNTTALWQWRLIFIAGCVVIFWLIKEQTTTQSNQNDVVPEK